MKSKESLEVIRPRFKFQGLCIGCGSTSSAPTYQDTANGTLISSSGTLPVVQTVAASSAVFGSAIDSFVFSEIAAEISADVAVWLGVEGFQAADELHESVQSRVDGLVMSPTCWYGIPRFDRWWLHGRYRNCSGCVVRCLRSRCGAEQFFH